MLSVKLDLIADVDVYQFIEKGMRDGVSCIKQTINTWNHTIKISLLNKLNTKILIIGMDGQSRR